MGGEVGRLKMMNHYNNNLPLQQYHYCGEYNYCGGTTAVLGSVSPVLHFFEIF